jgi:CIC family chloride channel protein
VVRDFWLGIGPIFPMAPMPDHFSWLLTPAALGFGMVTGLFAALVSNLMYKFEDLFHHLHVHWMWWPAIGGVGIGVGGYFFPRGLGVGYGNIADLLAGHATWGLVIGLLIAKTLMWTFSLGSGTSGGVLAPLLMIGGGFGALVATVAHCTPQEQALWALLGMAAMLSGSLGVPLTATVFAVELTHALPAFLPLMLAAAGAHLVTSLIMPRSILTEKLSRRGFHLTREYGVDALELVTVGEAMVAAVSDAARRAAIDVSQEEAESFAYSDETCREAAERMATMGRDTLPVLDRETQARVGELTMRALLVGRQRAFDREQMRLRPFGYGRHHE